MRFLRHDFKRSEPRGPAVAAVHSGGRKEPERFARRDGEQVEDLFKSTGGERRRRGKQGEPSVSLGSHRR